MDRNLYKYHKSDSRCTCMYTCTCTCGINVHVCIRPAPRKLWAYRSM